MGIDRADDNDKVRLRMESIDEMRRRWRGEFIERREEVETQESSRATLMLPIGNLKLALVSLSLSPCWWKKPGDWTFFPTYRPETANGMRSTRRTHQDIDSGGLTWDPQSELDPRQPAAMDSDFWATESMGERKRAREHVIFVQWMGDWLQIVFEGW